MKKVVTEHVSDDFCGTVLTKLKQMLVFQLGAKKGPNGASVSSSL